MVDHGERATFTILQRLAKCVALIAMMGQGTAWINVRAARLFGALVQDAANVGADRTFITH
jgi:hypothetical protein